VRLGSRIFLLNIIVLLAAIPLHESGHIATAGLLGCTGENVIVTSIMDPFLPGVYSEMLCPLAMGKYLYLMGLSGFMFLVPFSLSFLALGKRPERNLGLVTAGFSVVLAAIDLLLVCGDALVVYAAFASGVLVMYVGEFFLFDDYWHTTSHLRRTMRSMDRLLG